MAVLTRLFRGTRSCWLFRPVNSSRTALSNKQSDFPVFLLTANLIKSLQSLHQYKSTLQGGRYLFSDLSISFSIKNKVCANYVEAATFKNSVIINWTSVLLNSRLIPYTCLPAETFHVLARLRDEVNIPKSQVNASGTFHRHVRLEHTPIAITLINLTQLQAFQLRMKNMPALKKCI